MAERKKLAVIDGKSVFYRGYYAMPNLSTADGVPTGGVYGFATMALELIKKLKPDYVCVAWDKPKTNIRKRVEIYPEYKAGRKPAPPDFYTQIPILHDLLDAFGWPLYELDDYEADDIMGSLAVMAEKKGLETLLVTSDLDMLQLINHRVKVYALKRGFSNIEEYHPESFEQKYGLKPEQFLDLKALKGDSSDNIPGVPGIGEKTAIELLKEYKTLDGVYKHLEGIKGSTRKKLEAGRDSAYLSKKVGAIWCDAPLKLDLNAMDGTKIDAKALRTLLERLEFRSLLRGLPEHMKGEAPVTETVGGVKLKVGKNTVIDNDKDLPKIGDSEFFYIFGRAAGKHGADPQALIISPDGKDTYTLDLRKLDHKLVAGHFKDVRPLVGYDLKSTIKMLRVMGVKEIPPVGHDVLVAAYLINPLLRAQSLTELAGSQLRYEGSTLDELDTDELIARAPEIIAVIRELQHGQMKALEQAPKIEKLAGDVEWPLIPVLADMELTGIRLDCPYLEDFSKEIDGIISDLEQKIYGYADHEFNIGSPGQLADVLFVKLNLPTAGIKKGKTGLSTAASELEKLRGSHPIIDLIGQYREVTKLKNTYIDVLPKMVDKNSRLHTTYNITIAPTGRLSSVDPNLQAIPVRTDLGRRIRTAFVAAKGNRLVSVDYSQQELRIAAVLSGDQGMIDAFNKDEDIHIQTAALVYGIKPQDVTKEQRYAAKAFNFGIIYGQGPHGLSATSGLEYGQAREFITKYFEVRPKLKEFLDSLRQQAKEQGYVETIMGRRRPTPDVNSPNFVVRESGLRAAINMPMQGSAADIMKLAMVKIANKLPKSADILLQVHDSLIVEAPQEEAESVGRIMKQTMESVIELPVKLRADVSIGKNWGEL
ncbi:MAG TPA: DNA polymerase I [Candidatus Saccharimonadales bacterium]|nr:DNA polymerase I [Candidatus Saccharimonadales bacterium]